MTVYEVLKQNIRILEGMRIPVGERAIWDAVQGVLQNELACLDAMRRADAEKAEQTEQAEKPAEPGEEEKADG